MKTFDFIQMTISHNLKDPHPKALKPDRLSPFLAIATQSHRAGHAPVIDPQKMWSPSGIARGTIVHAQVGRHPGQTLAHSSTGKARGFLLPGYMG
jgi:hypothetical protein